MKEKTVDLRTGSNRAFHPVLTMREVRSITDHIAQGGEMCQVVTFFPLKTREERDALLLQQHFKHIYIWRSVARAFCETRLVMLWGCCQNSPQTCSKH